MISIELESEIWRAQTRLLSIKPEYDASEAELKAKLAKATAICGKDHVLADDRDSKRLKCTLKEKPTANTADKE